MIDFLRGRLAAKSLHEAVVDVGGIGFGVQIPMSTFDRLPNVGDEVTLHGHLLVRFSQDSMQIYGFWTELERQLFVTLTQNVSGIGPKLALNVLSTMTVDHFCDAIASHDIKALSRINGVGKRSAERLVMELKDKVQDLKPGAGLTSGATPQSAASDDAVAALVTLGFKQDAARKAVAELVNEDEVDRSNAESIIRKALILLNR